MDNPVTTGYAGRLFYLAIWAVIAVIHAMMLHFVAGMTGQIEIVAADSAIFNIVLALCLAQLWYPVRYNRLRGRGFWAYVATYTLIGALLVTVWLSLSFSAMHLLFEIDGAYNSFLIASLPWRAVEGGLMTAATVLGFYFYIDRQDCLSLRQRVEELEMQVEQRQQQSVEMIAVRRDRRVITLQLNEVSHIEADGDYVKIHSARGVFLKETTMKYLAESLPQGRFIRISRSYIVNAGHVEGIESYARDSWSVHLRGGAVVQASAMGRRELLNALNI